MTRWKKGALYLMCWKKDSDDRCQRTRGPCTVKPILTSSQPSDWSNYSLFLRAGKGDYHYLEKEWGFSFSAQPWALSSNQWSILCAHLSKPCLTRRHPFPKEINPNPESIRLWPGRVEERVCMWKWKCFLVIVFLVRWDVIWWRLWQLHYLGGVSPSASARSFSLGPLPFIYLFICCPRHDPSRSLYLPVKVLGSLYCQFCSFKGSLHWDVPPFSLCPMNASKNIFAACSTFTNMTS